MRAALAATIVAASLVILTGSAQARGTIICAPDYGFLSVHDMTCRAAERISGKFAARSQTAGPRATLRIEGFTVSGEGYTIKGHRGTRHFIWERHEP